MGKTGEDRVNVMAESRAGPKFGHPTFKFELQYLLQLYSKNLTIVLVPFTGTLRMV